MTNGLLKRIGSDKTLGEFLAVFRGFLAVAILFATLTVDVTVIEKYVISGLPQVPSTVLVGGFAIFIILLLGIGVIFTAFDKDNDEFKENKSLFVFFFGLGMILIAIAIYSGISLYSPYSKYIVEIALLIVNLLSLFAIGKLLDYKEV